MSAGSSSVAAVTVGAGVRVGNEGYAKANKSFGATTLRRRHAEVTGRTLRLSYKGKGGKPREVVLSDSSLSRVLIRLTLTSRLAKIDAYSQPITPAP